MQMRVPERRFNEVEVAAILERATTRHEPGRQIVPTTDGLTLEQLQDIGKEIGIDAGLITEAADSLGRGEQTATRRWLGLPVGVERIVHLRRPLTDEEWELLVVDLREIFNARGVLKRDGTLREWTNGNLQVLLERTDSAQRIRLRTSRGSAPGLMTLGIGAFGVGAAAVMTAVLRGATATPA